MQIIAFNGPPRSGKTHMTTEVIKAAPLQLSVQRISYVNAITPIAMNAAMAMGFRVPSDPETFKDTSFGSFTGRDIIISIVNGLKTLNPNVLIDMMDAQILGAHMRGVELVIVENVGSPGEWEAIQSFSKRMIPGSHLPSPMLFGLTERRTEPPLQTGSLDFETFETGRIYPHGKVFPGDSRVSYAHDYKMINPSVDEILSLCGFEV